MAQADPTRQDRQANRRSVVQHTNLLISGFCSARSQQAIRIGTCTIQAENTPLPPPPVPRNFRCGQLVLHARPAWPEKTLSLLPLRHRQSMSEEFGSGKLFSFLSAVN